MKTPKNAYRLAVDELADDYLSRQFQDNVSEADALKLVDWPVLRSWMAEELCNRTAKQLLGDVLDRQLTENSAKDVLAIATSEVSRSAQAIVAECLNAECAHDMSYESQKLVDSYEPTDNELAVNYASWVDDPLIADRRHFARVYR